jgi:hypothetical protein
MNLQVTAIRTETGNATNQSITHYQLLNLDNFNFATLSKPQVVAMVEGGTGVTVANIDGALVPCVINTQSLTDGTTQKWLQSKEDDSWTDDVLGLPHIKDINGAEKIRRYTTKQVSEVASDE